LASALAGSKLAQLTNFGTWTYFIVCHVSSALIYSHLKHEQLQIKGPVANSLDIIYSTKVTKMALESNIEMY